MQTQGSGSTQRISRELRMLCTHADNTCTLTNTCPADSHARRLPMPVRAAGAGGFFHSRGRRQGGFVALVVAVHGADVGGPRLLDAQVALALACRGKGGGRRRRRRRIRLEGAARALGSSAGEQTCTAGERWQAGKRPLAARGRRARAGRQLRAAKQAAVRPAGLTLQLVALLVHNHGLDAEEGERRRPRLLGPGSGQVGDHVSSRLGLPPGVHNGAAAVANHLSTEAGKAGGSRLLRCVCRVGAEARRGAGGTACAGHRSDVSRQERCKTRQAPKKLRDVAAPLSVPTSWYHFHASGLMGSPTEPSTRREERLQAGGGGCRRGGGPGGGGGKGPARSSARCGPGRQAQRRPACCSSPPHSLVLHPLPPLSLAWCTHGILVRHAMAWHGMRAARQRAPSGACVLRSLKLTCASSPTPLQSA